MTREWIPGSQLRRMLPPDTRPLARLVLISLLLTFVVARLVSILMMLHRMPDIYLHVRDTHVHHLNYGIFLLAGVGAYLLFSRSEEHTSELQSQSNLVCRLLLEKKNNHMLPHTRTEQSAI